MAKVIGLGNVIKNITLENELLAMRVFKGMISSVKDLEYEMDYQTPLVPIDTKAMRDSWEIRGQHTKNRMTVVGCYNVFYAPFVHEKTGAINWTLPGSGAKWLQIHFARNVDNMKTKIARIARTGKFGTNLMSNQFNVDRIQERQTVDYRGKGYEYRF